MDKEKKYLTYDQMEIERLKRNAHKYKEVNYIDYDKLEQEKRERQKNQPDMKPDSLIAGWFLYIFVMIGGLIFYDYFILAIAATIIFFTWRHDAIEKENGRK